MKKVKKASNLRRAMSSVEQSNRNYLKATHNRAERSVSMNTNSGAGGFNSLLRFVTNGKMTFIDYVLSLSCMFYC